MALPYSYENTFQISQREKVSASLTYSRLYEKLSSIYEIGQIEQGHLVLTYTTKALFGISFLIELQVSENGKQVDYEIKLNKLIQICVALVVFIALFSSFRFTGFLWFSFVFTLIFFVINIIVAEKSVLKLLKTVFPQDENYQSNVEQITPRQLEWIKDKSKCPACGEDITEYDRNCPECGLRLREKAPPEPFDISRFKNRRIKYSFRETRNNTKNEYKL
jgi:hypothetical protein